MCGLLGSDGVERHRHAQVRQLLRLARQVGAQQWACVQPAFVQGDAERVALGMQGQLRDRFGVVRAMQDHRDAQQRRRAARGA